MELNRVIRGTLDMIGRLSSALTTPTDWVDDLHHEEFSFKMAAYAAGMGEFGTGGSFLINGKYGGRLGAVSTDGNYADPSEPMTQQQLDEVYDMLHAKCRYEGAPGVSCSQEMIDACPGHAISANGIDRAKCQEHCRTIDKYIPSPEVCGKCFQVQISLCCPSRGTAIRHDRTRYKPKSCKRLSGDVFRTSARQSFLFTA